MPRGQLRRRTIRAGMAWRHRSARWRRAWRGMLHTAAHTSAFYDDPFAALFLHGIANLHGPSGGVGALGVHCDLHLRFVAIDGGLQDVDIHILQIQTLHGSKML